MAEKSNVIYLVPDFFKKFQHIETGEEYVGRLLPHQDSRLERVLRIETDNDSDDVSLTIDSAHYYEQGVCFRNDIADIYEIIPFIEDGIREFPSVGETSIGVYEGGPRLELPRITKIQHYSSMLICNVMDYEVSEQVFRGVKNYHGSPNGQDIYGLIQHYMAADQYYERKNSQERSPREDKEFLLDLMKKMNGQ